MEDQELRENQKRHSDGFHDRAVHYNLLPLCCDEMDVFLREEFSRAFELHAIHLWDQDNLSSTSSRFLRVYRRLSRTVASTRVATTFAVAPFIDGQLGSVWVALRWDELAKKHLVQLKLTDQGDCEDVYIVHLGCPKVISRTRA